MLFVSQVLSFKYKKQTSKNVAETTFKVFEKRYVLEESIVASER